jgi:hypothetical protein
VSKCTVSAGIRPAASEKVLADMRLRRSAERCFRLGIRVNVELAVKLCSMARDPAEAAAAVERFATIDPDLLRAVGADQMPARLIRAVSP